MIAGLTDVDRPRLAKLGTRDSDDFSIALLDAWAVTSDVLAFYNERLANESYLRTAREPDVAPGARRACSATGCGRASPRRRTSPSRSSRRRTCRRRRRRIPARRRR